MKSSRKTVQVCTLIMLLSEEQCAKIFLWILFAICGVILLILGVYLYCHISSGSSCQSYKHQIKHVWDRIKYYYYHYTQSKLRKFVWIQILFNEKEQNSLNSGNCTGEFECMWWGLFPKPIQIFCLNSSDFF